MGRFAVGDVVAVIFPFADFSSFKKRPALIVGLSEFENLILCQITSSATTSKRAIRLTDTDFDEGGLPVTSFIRPDKIITIDPVLVHRQLGRISNKKTEQVLQKVRELFTL